MRSNRAPRGVSHGAASYKTLMYVIVGVVMVMAFVYWGESKQGTDIRRRTMESGRLFTGRAGGLKDVASSETTGNQVTTGEATAMSSAATGHETTGEALGEIVGAVGKHDERHISNKEQILLEQSSHDEHASKSTATLMSEMSDSSEVTSGSGGAAAAAGSKGIDGAAAVAGGKDTKIVSSGDTAASTLADKDLVKDASSSASKDVVKDASSSASKDLDKDASSSASKDETSSPKITTLEVSSGVKSTAASLQHAASHLKEATDLLQKKAEESAAAAAAVTAGASKADAVTSGAVETKAAGVVASGATAAANVTALAPDLLAYSKEQNQPGDTIHVLFTSNGSPYQNFQARIMVGTYHLMRKMPGGEKLVAMTRILHRTTPDEVMDEIPTFRAEPLQPECDKWCWFPVADRANAVQQWINAAHVDHSLVKAPWLLMLEADYVWIKPLLARGSAYNLEVPGFGFKFDYISPTHPIAVEILKDKCPTCDPATVPGSGPAPVLMRFSDLRSATPLWEELSLWIETHKHAKDALGWVREMYAWDIGVAVHKLNILCEGHPNTPLIAQPPHDELPHAATMYHYTWGAIVKDASGTEVWKFDKRFYTDAKDALKVPRLTLPPPWAAGWVLQDGIPFSKNLHATMTDMLTLMNAAIDTLPNLLDKAAAVTAAA